MAWLPIPLLLAAMAVFWVADIRTTRDFPRLMMVVDFCCRTLACLLVMALAGRSFVRRGSPGLLLLGCGVAIWGGSGLVTTSSLLNSDVNLGVTISNLGLWLAASCHMAGVLLTRRSQRSIGAPGAWLAVGYALALAAVGLITWLTVAGKLPVFFVEDQGGKPIRDLALGSALAMLVATAALLWERNHRSRSPFACWYSLALLLIAVGVVGMLVQPARYSLLNWACRAAQYLSGIYMLIASLASVRESSTWYLSPEEALRDSERRFEALAAATFEGIAITENGRYTDANEQLLAMLGYNREEFVGREVAADIPLEVRDTVLSNLRAGRDSRMEHPLIRKDGSLITVEAHGKTIDYQDRKVRFTAIRDITDRKRAEEALRQSHVKLQKVLEVEAVGVMFWDLTTGRLVDANDTFLKMMGYSREDLGTEILTWQKFTPPEYHEASLAEIRKFQATGRVGPYEKQYLRKDGTRQWLLFSGSSLGENRCVEFCIDIADRKQAEAALLAREAELTQAQRVAHLGSWSWDARTDKGTASDELLRIFGFDPATQTIPDFAQQRGLWYPPEEWDRLNAAVQEAARTGRGYDLELQALRNGERIWVQTRSETVRDSAGQIVGLRGTVQDITDRKRADDALRESEDRFRLALKDSPVVVSIQDTNLVYRWTYNNRTRRPEDVIGKTDADLFAPEDVPAILEAKRRVLQNGEVVRHAQWLTSNGQRLFLDCHYEPLRDSAGRIIGVGLAAVNLTEQKRAEEALRQSEEQFRALAETITNLAWWANADGYITWYNRRWYEYTATTPQQMEGWGWQSVHDPQALPAVLERWKASIATGEPFEMTFPLRGADGQFRRFLTRVQPVKDAQGRVVRWFGTNTDVEELKRAEEAAQESERIYRAIGESLDYGIWICDAQGRNIYASDSLLKLVGITRDQCANFGWGNVLHPEDAQETIAAWQRCVASGSFWYREHRYLGVDGQYHPILACGVPVRNERGEVTTWAGINLDISRLKQTEEELKAARDSAERARAAAESASKAKDQFIAVLSHELRTPLTPAVAALSLLRKDVRLPHDVRDDLEMVSNNIDIEVRLIADLLDVSRIISGKLHLEKRPMDVADAIREAARIVSSDMDAKGQSLVIETPATPYRAFADAARLQQVFWNLLRNSIKFSPERSKIIVRARLDAVAHCPLAAEPCPVGMGKCPEPVSGNGQESCACNLAVEVVDEGCGIAPEMLPRLFNAFEQDLHARSFGGLGLGLSICRAVMEMHGGTISAHSAGRGMGATFTVRLPVAQCSLPVAALQGSRGSPARTTAPMRPRVEIHRLRVLLVEDHSDTAKVMRRMLMAQGHDVTVAGSVAEGLDAVKKQLPDVLISDMGLPDGNGLDLLLQLRAQGCQFPAIALSGYGTPADIARSKEAGFAEHLVKPLSSFDVVTDAFTRLGLCREPRPQI